MKDFHKSISIYIDLPEWVYDYTEPDEWPSDLTDSERLWLFLFCYEAMNNP